MKVKIKVGSEEEELEFQDVSIDLTLSYLKFRSFHKAIIAPQKNPVLLEHERIIFESLDKFMEKYFDKFNEYEKAFASRFEDVYAQMIKQIVEMQKKEEKSDE